MTNVLGDCNTPHLSLQAKSEIHSAISRQLESLRSREVWLLQQVELIQETKEDVLRQQKDQLHQAIGGLHNYLTCTDQDQDGETNLDRSMTRNLERFASYLALIGRDGVTT